MAKYLDSAGITYLWQKIKAANNALASDAAPMVETTWANLKSLRDNSKLVAGRQYRITDYQCTTTQINTKSAGHQFDIMVTADSTNKLNEVARAIQHSGDSYFANSKLEAWKIWYCLDNDTDRFGWADSSNGKGVIYRMIDEYNNDAPYDFKNILFTHTESEVFFTAGTASITYGYNGDFYTFGGTSDQSKTGGAHGNIIMPEYVHAQESTATKQLILNNIVVCGNSMGNTFAENCSHILLGNDSADNKFGCWCAYMKAGDFIRNNEFEGTCSNIVLSNYIVYNKFNKVGDLILEPNYMISNTFEAGTQGIKVTTTDTTADDSSDGSYDHYIKNYIFRVEAKTPIAVLCNIGRSYHTTVAKTSAGNVVQYCEADLSVAITDDAINTSAAANL